MTLVGSRRRATYGEQNIRVLRVYQVRDLLFANLVVDSFKTHPVERNPGDLPRRQQVLLFLESLVKAVD